VIWRWLFLILVAPVFVGCGSLEESAFARMGASSPGVGSEKFKSEIVKVGKAPISEGNGVRALENGDAYFPKMLSAVKGAKKSVEFEAFAMVDAVVTYDLVVALAERARAGVKVRVILDGAGSRNLREEYVLALRNAGAEVHFYRPFSYLRMWHWRGGLCSVLGW